MVIVGEILSYSKDYCNCHKQRSQENNLIYLPSEAIEWSVVNGLPEDGCQPDCSNGYRPMSGVIFPKWRLTMLELCVLASVNGVR